MSFLDQLTEIQRETLISLPYRVGLWISQSDEAGGEDASAQELQTLSNIIEGFARDVFGSEMLQYILAQTLLNKERWPAWAAQTQSVLVDCGMALYIMKSHGGDKDVGAFQNHLMEIGEAVALAFSEYEHQQGEGAFMLKMRYRIQNFKNSLAHKKKKSMQEFMSISAKERSALEELAKALGTTY